MSAYDNDPRVVKVNDARYDLPSPQGWTVRYEPEAREWRAVALDEDYSHPPFWPGETADEAICAVIGEPR